MSDISVIKTPSGDEYNVKDSTARSDLSNKVDKVANKELMPSDLISSNKLASSYFPDTIPNGVTATTQSAGDNSTKVATTAYVDTAVAGGGGGGANTSIIAPTFNTTTTYSLGDYCIKDNVLYYYNNSTPSSGAWDSTKWTGTTVVGEIGTINEILESVL